MKRSLGGLMAAALLLAGISTPTTTTAPAPATASQKVQPGDSTTTYRTPKAPAKPVATARKVQYEARPLSVLDYTPRFVGRPERRKVKYGKSQWIILG